MIIIGLTRACVGSTCAHAHACAQRTCAYVYIYLYYILYYDL